MTALDRAARALYDADRANDYPDDTRPDWDACKSEYIADARAVLLAVLEHAPTKAMAESCAVDDEGAFEPLCDLIGFSGENKTHTVLRKAWVDGIQAILSEGE